ncbi:DUF6519 domain-containing protein [Geodermatophilus sp. SYSU D00710]
MSGDITRRSFDPRKRYSAVRQQQGRVQTDADWNEDRDIALFEQRQGRSDLIGRHGAPLRNPGFKVALRAGDNSQLQTGAGRYYVDGIRIDADVPTDLEKTPTVVGNYLVYLDVWERTVTAVEDPTIREVALGGPDTATRMQVLWKARALQVAGATLTCGTNAPEWNALIERDATGTDTRGKLRVTSDGFRPRENRTYRVQIHQGNIDPTTGKPNGKAPTFVWSRDNGAVLAAWTAAPKDFDVQVDRPGPGGAAGFAPGALVELSTDESDARLEPGLLATVGSVTGRTLRLEGTSIPGDDPKKQLTDAFKGTNPKVRRWDSPAPVPVPPAGTTVALDNGLRVEVKGDRWRTGDHWIIPARSAVLPGTVDRQIEWPADAGGVAQFVAPHGPEHHYVRLAVAKLTAPNTWALEECRKIFPPLTGPTTDALHLPPVTGGGEGARPTEGSATTDAGGAEPVAVGPDTVVPVAAWSGQLSLHLPFPLAEGISARTLDAAVDVTVEIPAAGGRWPGGREPHRMPGAASIDRRNSDATDLTWVGDGSALTAEDVAHGEVLVRVTVHLGLLTRNPLAPGWRTAFYVGA